MTQQEAQALYAVLLRLVDQGQTLTPTERRDILNQIVHARCEQTVEDVLAATTNQRKLRLKRGTTAENDLYTGLSGEVTIDTDEHTLRIHDGETPGGHPVTAAVPDTGGVSLPENMEYVVESQFPTAENNYTWYRKYNSGWVEQGGVWTGSKSCGYGQETSIVVNLPVEMQDTNYYVGAMVSSIYLSHMGQVANKTSVQFRFGAYSTNRTLSRFVWNACGIAA